MAARIYYSFCDSCQNFLISFNLRKGIFLFGRKINSSLQTYKWAEDKTYYKFMIQFLKMPLPPCGVLYCTSLFKLLRKIYSCFLNWSFWYRLYILCCFTLPCLYTRLPTEIFHHIMNSRDVVAFIHIWHTMTHRHNKWMNY